MDFDQTWYILRESGTLLILKVIGQRSRSPGQIVRQGDTPRFALPLFCVVFCRSLFILLSFYFWPLYFLSFFDQRLLITISVIFKLLVAGFRTTDYI
jgi:hypothetical protein